MILLDRLRIYNLWRGVPMPEGDVDHLADEVRELKEALADHHAGHSDASRGKVMAEIADVVLGATAIAYEEGVTVEECIEYKTALDRGRGPKVTT